MVLVRLSREHLCAWLWQTQISGQFLFSGQFDAGSDNSSVTEKLKGAVALRSFSQSLMNTRNLLSRGIGGGGL